MQGDHLRQPPGYHRPASRRLGGILTTIAFRLMVTPWESNHDTSLASVHFPLCYEEFGLFRSYIRTSSIFAGPGSGAQRTLLHGTATHASIASLRVITWGRMRCLAVLTCHTMLPSPVGPAGSRAARAARAERSCHWRSEKFGVSGFSIRGCDI